MNRHKHGDPLRSVLHTPEAPDSYICSNCKVLVTEAHHDKYPECLVCWYARTRELPEGHHLRRAPGSLAKEAAV